MDVWSVSGCSHYRQLKEPSGEITRGSFSADGWRVLTVSSRNTARVWSLGRDWASYTFHHEDTINSAAFAPDGVQVVTTSRGDAWLWLIDGQTPGRCLPQRKVWWARFSPDSKCVLLRHSNGIAMWSATVTELCWSDTDKDIMAVAFSH